MNQFIAAQRTNRYKGAAIKKSSQKAVVDCIMQQLSGVKITNPVRLEYSYFEPNKKRDLDNVSGFAHKIIQDALVECGVLENDGWKQVVGFSDSFFVDADNPRIEVLIMEVG